MNATDETMANAKDVTPKNGYLTKMIDGVKWLFEKTTNLIVKFTSGSVKMIGLIVILAALAWFTFPAAQKAMLQMKDAAFSSPTSPHVINLGKVNAHFNNAWVFGIEQISMKSPVIKSGWLEADGDIYLKCVTPDGTAFKIKSTVAIEPALDSGIAHKYRIMGSGISGSFETVAGSEDLTFRDFNINLNMSLVEK